MTQHKKLPNEGSLSIQISLLYAAMYIAPYDRMNEQVQRVRF